MSQKSKAELKEWLTRQEVMALLSVSTATIRNYEQRGILQRYKIVSSRLMRYRRRDVENLLQPDSPDGELSMGTSG
jgi:predicted site-specific integrase-resolvase